MNLGKRIMVMGNSSGSGKSTMARKLGELLGLPVVHGDVLGYQPSWVPVPKDECEQAFYAAAAQSAWVIDGEFRACAFEYRLERADTIIYLDINVMVCVYRALKRSVSYSSKARPDKPEGAVDKLTWQYLSAVLARRTRNRRKTQILARLVEIEPPKQVFHLKGRRVVKKFWHNWRKHNESWQTHHGHRFFRLRQKHHGAPHWRNHRPACLPHG